MANSTPSKNRTAVRSQTGNTENLVFQLKPDVIEDINDAQTCDFDDFLKYFLYLVLDANSKERISLDSLQAKIEKLEEELAYHEGASDRGEQQGHSEGTITQPGPSNQAGLAPTGGPKQDAFDEQKAIRELAKSKVERHTELDAVFQRCLSAMLPICNEQDSNIRRELKKYYSEKSDERYRYDPYISACHHALDVLKNLSDLPLRGVSKLGLRFHRNDPKVMKSTYGPSTVERKPDVVGTSAIAAEDQVDTDYTSPLKDAFRWSQVLLVNEFKMGKNQPKTKEVILDSYTEKRQVVVKCDDEELHTLYPLHEGTPIPDDTSERSSKRQKVAHEPTGSSKSKKRGPNSKKVSGSKGKATTSLADTTTIISKKSSIAAIDARTQCALYGLEMLSYDIGVHHAITWLFIDTHLWIWYYDRQGIIQSTGIDFIRDLPRFLVLLLAFQRFELQDWGVIPALNPSAVLAHNTHPVYNKPKATRPKPTDAAKARATPITKFSFDATPYLDSVQKAKGDQPRQITINLDDNLSHKPHCLAGRATAVFSASDSGDPDFPDLACKIYHPEVIRQNEGEMLDYIRQMVMEKDPSMEKHLPHMLYHGDISGCSTLRIRSMMSLEWKGHRTTRFIVFKKLKPLTTLVGRKFVEAWLEAVKFHVFLWKNGVEHGDPSLWNIMYDPKHTCGVLTDYDLSIFRHLPRVPGFDRTGTIPFMAVGLLNDRYWKGNLERLYPHELEAFIWILPFVFVQYQDQKPRKGTIIDAWITSNHKTCYEKKWTFADDDNLVNLVEQVQEDFRTEWPLARRLLRWALTTHFQRTLQPLEGEDKPTSVVDTNMAGVWNNFVNQLTLGAKVEGLQYVATAVRDLGLEKLFVDSVTSNIASSSKS